MSQECEELHVLFESQFVVFSDCLGSRAFYKWFTEIFVKQNPIIEESFEMVFTEAAGNKVLEVTCYEPDFSIPSVTKLWDAYKMQQEEDEESKAIPFN